VLFLEEEANKQILGARLEKRFASIEGVTVALARTWKSAGVISLGKGVAPRG